MPYQFMRNDLDERYGLIPLQEKILEIAVYMDKICREHGIRYYLMGGSALGAKRHGGFIPWDDDLDFFMTPDDYEKFREAFRKEANQEMFYLQEWGAVDGMVTISKVRMNGTTYIEEKIKNWNIHQGIYVDIFMLHTCPNQKVLQLLQCFWAKYVIMKGLAERGYNRRKGFLGFVLKVMRLFPEWMWVKHGLKQVYKYRSWKTNNYCNFLGKAVFQNAIYKKSYFGEGRYVPFEKVELKVPTNVHEFLSDRFGDYMKPPSSEKIKRDQHAESWSIDTDFRVVLKTQSDICSDEKKLI
jgi:lipopolysaccharide cholinephosphotransferase